MPDLPSDVLANCRAWVEEAWDHQDRFDALLARAEACLRQALIEAPDDTRLLTGLGAVLCDRNQYRDAASTLEHAVRGGSQDRNTLFNLGVARQGIGATRDAMAAFTDARRHAASPQTWTAYFDPHAL